MGSFHQVAVMLADASIHVGAKDPCILPDTTMDAGVRQHDIAWREAA